MEQSHHIDVERDPSFSFIESFVNISDFYKRAGTTGIANAEAYISPVK